MNILAVQTDERVKDGFGSHGCSIRRPISVNNGNAAGQVMGCIGKKLMKI